MNWKIWTKKILWNVLAVVIAGGISVYAENPYWLAILPILEGLRNYIKHK